MKFRFKLETVLKIRKHEEELQKQKLGVIMQRKQLINSRLQKIQSVMTEMNDQYLSKSQMDVRNLRGYYASLQDKQEVIWDLRQQLAETDKEIIKQRNVLLEANRKTQMLEKLKSKALLTFVQEMDRKEQVELNEMATQKYNHSN
ncbi:MAG TPA: flagellar FliJ family protein [Balneolales bacterium]|nr:flagellar FliJ family protein [Balneolales bacterium]